MAAPERISDKFSRIFDLIDDLKERVITVEVHEEVEQKKLDELSVRLDEMRTILNQIVGKEAVRSSIAGVVGAIVAGVVTWVITLVRG